MCALLSALASVLLTLYMYWNDTFSYNMACSIHAVHAASSKWGSWVWLVVRTCTVAWLLYMILMWPPRLPSYTYVCRATMALCASRRFIIVLVSSEMVPWSWWK